MAFRWNNLSKGLAKELARPAGLRVSSAAEDLANKFGEPPNDALVEELWPVLRDRWLATRPVSRKRVVTKLRKAALGDTAMAISTKAGQMDYLRSCRTSARLKGIVLAAFIDEGSQLMMAPSVLVPIGPDPAAKDTANAAGQPPPQIMPPDQPIPPSPSDVRARVVAIMLELTGHAPTFDTDGDIPMAAGSARLFLRVLDANESLPMIRVFGQLVRGVQPSLELLGDLNEANQRCSLCRLLHVGDTVVVDGYIPAAHLTAHELSFLLDESLSASDHLDTLLANRHGGTTLGADRGEVMDV